MDEQFQRLSANSSWQTSSTSFDASTTDDISSMWRSQTNRCSLNNDLTLLQSEEVFQADSLSKDIALNEFETTMSLILQSLNTHYYCFDADS